MNEERIAALEQWLETLEETFEAHRRDFADRLAALQSPGVVPVVEAVLRDKLNDAEAYGANWSKRAEIADAALATARRERDEAVGVVRDWLGWRAGSKGPGFDAIVDRARALVAGQATPDARDAEIAGWREASKAMTGEIATLRAQLDTALARVAELEAREVAANHRALGLQYELDTVVAALQERDRESRWIIEHIPMMQGSPTFEARVAEYLSATPPADPARGLIERAVEALAQWHGPWCGAITAESLENLTEPLLADLRAYLGGGTGARPHASSAANPPHATARTKGRRLLTPATTAAGMGRMMGGAARSIASPPSRPAWSRRRWRKPCGADR